MLKKEVAHAQDAADLKTSELQRLLTEALYALAAEKTANDLLRVRIPSGMENSDVESQLLAASELLSQANDRIAALRDEIL
jgi:hypothetical protein